MKSWFLFIAFVITVFVLGCTKDNVDTGAIRYSNFSTAGHRYQLFLDGKSLGLLSAGVYYDKTGVPVGSHIIKATQYEGIVVAPIVIEHTVNVVKGDTLQFQFP